MLEYTAGALLSLSICEGSVTRSWLIEKPLLTLLSLLPNYLISCDSGGFSWTKQASSHRFLAGFGQQINTGCARCSWNVYDAHGGGLMRFFGWATIKHMYILYNWYYTIDIIWYYIYIYYILHITYYCRLCIGDDTSYIIISDTVSKLYINVIWNITSYIEELYTFFKR